MQYAEWYYKVLGILSLPDYAHNPIFQELLKMNEYVASGDEKLFIDLRHRKGYTWKLEKINRDDTDSNNYIIFIHVIK